MTVSDPKISERRWNADENRWDEVKRVIGVHRVTLGPQASQQWIEAPDHLAMVLARYRAAAALIGDARSVLEIGCGEGIGAGILAKGRGYVGVDADEDGIRAARRVYPYLGFLTWDVLSSDWQETQGHEATIALDVIEHIPAGLEESFMAALHRPLTPHGVCVIGTPNKTAEHLASPQSKAGHVNLFTHDRLHDLMARYFSVVQMLGMNDVSLHTGHPAMRHYLITVGIGPK